MAYKIIKINGKPNSSSQKSYLLTDSSELKKLPKCGIKGTQNSPDDTVADEPCAFGSTALVCTQNSTEEYILTPDNEWTLVKTYMKESSQTSGGSSGKNVVISNISPIDGGHRITFSYTLDDGTAKTSTLDVMDGKDGNKGENGIGIPKGGLVGQILVKSSNDDYDTQWIDMPENINNDEYTMIQGVLETTLNETNNNYTLVQGIL